MPQYHCPASSSTDVSTSGSGRHGAGIRGSASATMRTRSAPSPPINGPEVQLVSTTAATSSSTPMVRLARKPGSDPECPTSSRPSRCWSCSPSPYAAPSTTSEASAGEAGARISRTVSAPSTLSSPCVRKTANRARSPVVDQS
ncbi:hypothetical protein STENM223S_00767 [Streptomyces tendae]